LIKNSAMAKDELDAMEMMIRFKHYCPTAPFSLKTEPFVEDYLIIEETPNVMISGKASKYDSRAIKVGDGQVLLVSIPQNRMAVVCIDGSSVKGLR
jgi:DNA polymerase II small subunit/DNA polymerase delta subunit B